jgi:hypothetical protein
MCVGVIPCLKRSIRSDRVSPCDGADYHFFACFY